MLLFMRPGQPARSLQVRKFAAEQYAQNGLHLHPLTTPEQLEKLENGRLRFRGARRSGAQVWLLPALGARLRPGWWAGCANQQAAADATHGASTHATLPSVLPICSCHVVL